MGGYNTLRRMGNLDKTYDHEILSLLGCNPDGMSFDDILGRFVGGGSQFVERSLTRLTDSGYLVHEDSKWRLAC